MPEPPDRDVIVYADHSELEPRLARKILERAGVDLDVVHVADCDEAVRRRFAEPVPRGLILRGLMPGLDGPDAIARIRRREAEEGLPRAPLAIVSSSAAYVDRGLAAGADSSLLRPFTPAELRAVVTEMLGRASQPERS